MWASRRKRWQNERSAGVRAARLTPSGGRRWARKAEWLLECEPVTFGTMGVRVHKAASGEVAVTDSSLAETTEREILFSLFLRLGIEKVVHHRDDDIHALQAGRRVALRD